MGCGCLKPKAADVREPLRAGDITKNEQPETTPLMGSSQASQALPPHDGSPLAAQLAPVIQAAGKSSRVPDSTIAEVLSSLSALSPASSSRWLHDWSGKASVKARGGLFQLMQRVVGQALDRNVTLAEELIASEASETSSFGQLSGLCMDTLSLEESHRNGVRAAMMLLSHASSSGQVDAATPIVVSALDRLVLLFRPSLLAHIATTADNKRLWSELETHIGLPPLEQHLSLFSCSAKAVLLNLRLVPDGVPAAVMVVKREAALADAMEKLPVGSACVLSPYFESSSGSKIVQGRRVEGGEGHGPRKEFFIATSEDALRRWSSAPAASPPGSPAPNVQVLFQGNRVRFEQHSNVASSKQAAKDCQLVKRALVSARVGDRLKFEFSDGNEAERLITAMHEDTGVSVASLFDSSVCSGTVTVRQCGLQKALKPLFEFHRGSGQTWFGAYASELTHSSYGKDLQSRYSTFGKLLVLAVANRCKISFVLPDIFFHLLLHSDKTFTLDDLKGFDDDLHSSLKKCLKMSKSDFNALKEIDDLPSQMSKEDYVAGKVKETFTPQAMSEIRKGFWSLANKDIFSQVTASDLRQIVCPTESLDKDIDIKRIFKVVIEEEMSECKPFVDAFWSVVDGFSMEEKKLFLQFVTGLAVPPESGTERLLIELPFSAFSKGEHSAMLDKLPQAHTCTNTLELPNYHDALIESGEFSAERGEALQKELQRVLGEKLRMAIRETGGYELDATEVESSFPPAHPTSHELEAREREAQPIQADIIKSDPSRWSIDPLPATPSVHSGVSDGPEAVSDMPEAAVPPSSAGHESSCSLQSLPGPPKPTASAWADVAAESSQAASTQALAESDRFGQGQTSVQPWEALRAEPGELQADLLEDSCDPNNQSKSLEDVPSQPLRGDMEVRDVTSISALDTQLPGGNSDSQMKAPVAFLGELGFGPSASDEDASVLASLLQGPDLGSDRDAPKKITGSSEIDNLIEELDML